MLQEVLQDVATHIAEVDGLDARSEVTQIPVEEVNRVRRLPAIALVNLHPNIDIMGGTMIIAIIVMAAFANVANAGGCSYSKSKPAEVTTEEVKDTADKKAEVEA